MGDKLNLQINTGLIIEQKESDFILGANSPIGHEKRNLTRDWRLFRSRAERQTYKNTDAMNCVSQYATNNWEAQANWMFENNLWPEDALSFWNNNGYLIDGKFEISERFTAKLSGTTRVGNTFQNVLDSIRKDGVVPEIKWPAQGHPNIDTFNWEKYYESIPDELISLGKESLKYFSMAYERIDAGTQLQKKEVIRYALEHAPVGFAIATCNPWGARVPVCYQNANHAVTCDAFETSYIVWDSYEPFEKFLEPGYEIHYAVKAVLYPVKRNEPVKPPQVLDKDIVFGQVGLEVVKLRDALNKLGWTNNITSMEYNRELAGVVFRFQLANLRTYLEMILSLKGRRVGPRTREELNRLLSLRK